MSDSRDDLEIEALVTDRYLDSLLAARERRGAPDAPGSPLDPNVRIAAGALEAQLSRVHPSFRFEERLAADLQAAARQRRGGRSIRPSAIRRLELRQSGSTRALQPPPTLVAAGRSAMAGRSATPGRPTAAGAAANRPAPAGPQVSRPLLIGGALTSAAISIAGAYVAWRRGRPPVNPMVRAVRAAHRSGFARRIPSHMSRPALSRGSRSR